MKKKDLDGDGIGMPPDDAAREAFREVFKPDMGNVVKALARFVLLHMKAKALRITTVTEDVGIHKALSVIVGHLEYAYPGLRKELWKL